MARNAIEVDMEQDRPCEDAQSEVALSQEEQHRFEPPNGAISKWPRHGLPLPIISEPRSPVTGATANLGGPGVGPRRLGATAPIFPELTQCRRNAGIKTPTQVELERDLGFPGPGGQLPRGGTQFEPDPYEDVLPRKLTLIVGEGCGLDMAGRSRSSWSPDAALMDTVARLQLDLDEMRAGSWCHRIRCGRVRRATRDR